MVLSMLLDFTKYDPSFDLNTFLDDSFTGLEKVCFSQTLKMLQTCHVSVYTRSIDF